MKRGEREVAAFSELMLEKLEANGYKGALRGNPAWALIDLREEVKELAEEIEDGTSESIGAEAADVANYAMIIAASVGALDGIEPEIEL